MSLGRKDIVKNITSKALISSKISKEVLSKFLDLISSKSQRSVVKFSKFGTFYYHKSPIRVGRNPLTREEYTISKRFKLSFKPSNKVKILIN
tara:strand:- start:50 stop:325 length:276 start_codon:yes stop_codon:yes gene_type:complete